MPLWLSTLSGRLYEADESYAPKIPYVNLVSSIFSLTIPLIAGVLMCRWKPAARHFTARIIKPFTLLLVAFVLTV
jgi:hypothetical protein